MRFSYVKIIIVDHRPFLLGFVTSRQLDRFRGNNLRILGVLGGVVLLLGGSQLAVLGTLVQLGKQDLGALGVLVQPQLTLLEVSELAHPLLTPLGFSQVAELVHLVGNPKSSLLAVVGGHSVLVV
jgi:hypothetical protein